ncbi:DUF935 domain-containing protein [Tropicimonas sp. S265A]|uniref:DUF935 domain-containing protein n=1 Tax=Tropicimonas sp. S265A TaxID=3415134 RepID=UPI003C7B30BA
MVKLLDQYGRDMKRPAARELDDEIAAPGFGSVRQITQGHPADGLRPQRLAAILKNAEVNDATEFLQMAEQLEEKDLHYAAVLGVRKRAVRNLELVVEAGGETDADQDAAALVRAELEKPVVRRALPHIMDALGKGYSVNEILWDRTKEPWTIRAIKFRDPTWFKYDTVDGETLRLRDNTGELDLPFGRFVYHRAELKSGLPIRAGLARLCAWAYMFKNYTLRDWAIFLTTYGHPVRVGKYDTSATEEDKRTLLRAMRQVGTDMAAIMPRSMEAEFINAAVTGGDKMFETSARYWDEQLSKAVLGQVATTDAIAGGHAVGKIHELVRSDIRDADGEQLAATLEADIARPLVVWNHGPNVACPAISLVSPKEHDPAQMMQAINTFGPKGLKVPVAVVQETYGIREPEEGEALLDFSRAVPRGGALDDSTPDPSDVTQREASAAISGLIDQVRDGPYAEPGDELVEAFLEALEGAETPEEARDILEDLMTQTPPEKLAEFLARLAFNARLAGELGADIG